MRAEDRVGVEVPATCANLGPGFDVLAVAVDLRLAAWTDAPGDERRVHLEGEGSDELPTDDTNLVWRALTAYCDWAGVAVPEVSLHVRSEIPLERGLGSSAAAAVAGVTLGRAATAGGGRDADLLDLAASFDGHADNAAAALHGGLVVVVDGIVQCLAPTDALRPVVCVPEQRQATTAARALLPDTVPLADAAANGGRAALVVAGLSGAAALQPEALRDVLHEPARLAAMPDSGRLVEGLRATGVAACLSGAGPTVLALVPSHAGDAAAVEELAGRGWRVGLRRWHRAGAVASPPTVLPGSTSAQLAGRSSRR